MSTLRLVFSKPLYIALALSVSLALFTFSIWLPNWQLLVSIMPSTMATIPEKISLVWSLYGSIQTNFTVLSAVYTILIAFLFGINVALFVYYIRTHQGDVSVKNSTLGIGGVISGIFGIGCSACGSFILSILLGFFGGVWIITLLPLGGEEFGILGVALLGYSVYAILKKIKEPLVCKEE